jgi:signal transduction histidine kinase
MNLIGNAIKHHDRPQEGRVSVSVADAGELYEFRVADDGPGIDPAYHEKVFVIFQTLEPRDKVEGTGIGLAIVKKTVERFGGAVRVESAGRGSRGATFAFTWPRRPPLDERGGA